MRVTVFDANGTALELLGGETYLVVMKGQFKSRRLFAENFAEISLKTPLDFYRSNFANILFYLTVIYDFI